MKRHILHTLFLSVAVLFSSSAMAISWDDFDFFVGGDIQGREMDFEDRFGANVYANSFSQWDIYAGTRFFDYFGLAVGHESTSKKTKNATVNEGDYYLGIFNAVGDGIESRTTETRVSGTFVDFMGFWPIFQPCNVDIFGSIGFVRANLEINDRFTATDGVPNIPVVYRSYDEKKTLLRLTLGLQAVFWEHLGVRIMGGWEDTSRFSGLKPQENSAALTNVNVKDSWIYGIGLFLTT